VVYNPTIKPMPQEQAIFFEFMVKF